MPGKAQPKYALSFLIAAIVGCHEREVVHVRELVDGGAQAMLADGRKMKFNERQLGDAAYHLDLQEEARLQAGKVGERLTSPARRRRGEKPLRAEQEPRQRKGQA